MSYDPPKGKAPHPIPAPTFVTQDFILRRVRLRDAPAIYRALKDPEMTRHVPVPQPYRFRHALKFCLRSVIGRWRGTRVDYLIFLRETGELLSCRMHTRIRWSEPREAELGTWKVRSWWGRKYGPQPRNRFHPYVFETLGIHRLYWTANVENKRAIGSRKPHPRRAEEEGTLRHAVYHHGRWHDVRVFAQLKTDPGMVALLEALRTGAELPL